MVMAKGLASGFPISAIASSREMMSKWQVGTHGGTFGGNPMGCAAAEATLKVIREEGLVENAAIRGKQLLDGLAEIQSHFPTLGDVRGLGLMVGCEFTSPPHRPARRLTKRVAKSALEDSRLLLPTCDMRQRHPLDSAGRHRSSDQ
jgi:4-aminobutyrate aminotransferase